MSRLLPALFVSALALAPAAASAQYYAAPAYRDREVVVERYAPREREVVVVRRDYDRGYGYDRPWRHRHHHHWDRGYGWGGDRWDRY